MPELPEVETIRKGLAPKLMGVVIRQVEIKAEQSFQGNPDLVLGAKVIGLERFGKLMVWKLSNGLNLAIHLKMTGQLIWRSLKSKETVMGGHPEAAYLEEYPNKHTRVIFHFPDSKVYFNDLRRFGFIKVLADNELKELAFIQKLGLEPFHPQFTEAYLAKHAIRHPRLTIKAFLLDQAIVAGLGNIYVDESLFKAGIKPTRLVGSITAPEWSKLVPATKATLETALKHNGSTEKDYRTAIGEKGTFLQVANVYRKTGLPCKICGNPILRSKVAGRSSHFCAICQN